jgi:hypothetical protein
MLKRMSKGCIWMALQPGFMEVCVRHVGAGGCTILIWSQWRLGERILFTDTKWGKDMATTVFHFRGIQGKIGGIPPMRAGF